MSLGKMCLSAILAEGTITGLLKHGNIDHLFRGNEVEPHQFVKDFVKEYGTLPTWETIENHTGESVVEHKENSGYYIDLLKSRYTEFILKKTMKDASDLLLPQNKDPDASLEKLSSGVMELSLVKQQGLIADFRKVDDIITPYYKQQVLGDTGGKLDFGWPYFDERTGGIRPGDLVSFVGRPAAGKTFQMLYSALHGWRESCLKAVEEKDEKHLEGASRLFVSMEMPILQIMQRLAAMQAHVPMNYVKYASLGTVGLKKLKDSMFEVKGYGAPFWVVDGNLTATVEDIWMLIRQLKPGAAFIDGGYLVGHKTERDRYRRVAENVNLMKKELSRDTPTVVSWQFAKTASKKMAKKGESVGLEDIGYTDAIAQDSSIAMGIFEEESVETLLRRKINILKGRHGETGSFYTNWNFVTMDFSEFPEENVEELQFL